MKTVFPIYAKLAQALIDNEAYKATKFLSEKRTIVATRRLYRKSGKGFDHDTMEITFTDSRPNYENRQFIKLAKKSGESFPIRKIQLKFPPKRK